MTFFTVWFTKIWFHVKSEWQANFQKFFKKWLSPMWKWWDISSSSIIAISSLVRSLSNTFQTCIEATSSSYNYKQTADVAFSLEIKQKFFNLASSELQFLKIELMNFRFLKNLWVRQGHSGNFYSYLGIKSCKFLSQKMSQNTLIIWDSYGYNSTLIVLVLYKYSKAVVIMPWYWKMFFQ